MNPQASIVRFGPFRFDRSQQELRHRGRRVRISVSLIKLLTLFLSRPGDLVTREQIADALWEDPETVDVVIGINMAVRRLRVVLDDDPANPRYIETVIGLGYRFVAEVEELEETGGAETPAAQIGTKVAVPQAEDSPQGEILLDVGNSQLTTSETPLGFIAQRPGRSNFYWFAGLVLGATLLLGCFGIAAFRHRTPHQAGSLQAPVSNPVLNAGQPQITFNDEDDNVTAAAISPDGHVVAYADRIGISLHSLDNGTDALGTAPPSFLIQRISWYPNMRGLAVSGFDRVSHRNMVWKISLGSTPQMLLSDADLATVSPDSGSIAYTRRQNTEIWLADGSGQNSRLLVPRVEGESVAALIWSPKGNKLVFDRMSAASAGDDPPNAANTSASVPANSGPANYESVDASTGKLLSREQNIRFDSGFLLNDGRLIFSVNGVPGHSKLMVVKTDPETGRFLSSPQPVASPPGWNLVNAEAVESLSVSANGEMLGAVLTTNTPDVYWAQIQQPGPVLRGVTRLTGELNGLPHAWSPNGDAVVFDGYNGENLICRQRIGETKPEIMAKLPQDAAMANYSPDGKWILFAEYAGFPGHAIGIFSIPADGGQPRQLSTTGNIDEFHCSVSFTGACVMRETVNNKEFVFYALDPVRGMGQELARTKWNSTLTGDWTVSPDGASVAMADHDPDHPAFRLIPLSPHGSAPISTIPVRGLGSVLESTWAADGKGFYVETKTATGYDLLYVDRAGHTKLLRESPFLIWGIPSRDGKKLAFPGLTVRSNVWVGHTSFLPL